MSAILGDALITYDLNTGHKIVKDAMKSKGYFEYVTLDNKGYYLPNTTLWKPRTSTDQAMTDLKNACSAARITLEKAVAVLATDWVAYNQ